MKRMVRIFLAGLMVVVPFAITVGIFWWVAGWIGSMGYQLMDKLNAIHPETTDRDKMIAAFLGGLALLASIYVVGLLTHVLVFRRLLQWVEKMVIHLPGAKTIYESVRDLMKLFGDDSRKMGRSILYKMPNTDIVMMGILTNDQPQAVNAPGTPADKKKVAVYFPFSYMLGGLTIYVETRHLQETTLTVDQVLKLCTTAHVGGGGNDAENLYEEISHHPVGSLLETVFSDKTEENNKDDKPAKS